VLLQEMAEVENGGFIRNRIGQSQPHEAAHGFDSFLANLGMGDRHSCLMHAT
jgi:hypothetical protein